MYLHHGKIGCSLGVPQQQTPSDVGQHVHDNEDGSRQTRMVVTPCSAKEALHSKLVAAMKEEDTQYSYQLALQHYACHNGA